MEKCVPKHYGFNFQSMWAYETGLTDDRHICDRHVHERIADIDPLPLPCTRMDR